MKYEIAITADHNDGDYITSVNKISQKDLDTIKPLIAAINAKKEGFWHSHNYETGDCCRDKSVREIYNFDESVFELFEEQLPYNEYGIHTIESITICPWKSKTKLL